MDVRQIIADPTLSPEAKVILVTGEIEKQLREVHEEEAERQGMLSMVKQMGESSMDYIFIEGEGSTGIFLRESIITSITFDREANTATITTSEHEATEDGRSQQRTYRVQGFMAVHALHDHFYQRTSLKLWTGKK